MCVVCFTLGRDIHSSGDRGDPQAFLNAADRGGFSPVGTTSFTIDEAAAQLVRAGRSWAAQVVTVPMPATVTYGFRATESWFYNPGVTGFSQFNSQQIQQAELALQSWSDVANITFVRVGSGDSGPGAYTDDAMMLFGNYSSGADWAAAFAYYPYPIYWQGGYLEGDSFYNSNLWYNQAPEVWNYGRTVLVHEIGHAIGLGHPGDYNAGTGYPSYADAVYYEDTRQYSVMSYWSETHTGANHGGYYAAGPLLDDIAAAQRLYGANMNTRTGDTTYGFNSNSGRDHLSAVAANSVLIFAVWDAGGTDTFDFSGYAQDQFIDLREGHFSSVGGLTGNVAVASGVTIENAIGGAGADAIVGNAANNGLFGGRGDDVLTGGAGADVLSGAEGFDRLYGGEGGDTIYGGDLTDVAFGGADGDYIVGGSGADYLDGEEGDDTLWGEADNDEVYGGAGADTLEGHDGDDVMGGGDGADRLDGGAGLDRLYGGDGADTLLGGDDTDVLFGGADADALTGGAGADYIDGEAGDDAAWGGAGADEIYGGAGADRLFGQEGADVMGGGDGADELYGGEDDDRLYGGEGRDLLSGGDGYDRLDGGGGGDDLYGGGSGDAIFGGEGADFVDAGDGGDYVEGGAGEDYVLGGAGSDEIYAGGGNDIIIGGAGADILSGGAGADRFAFSGVTDSASGAADWITDFAAWEGDLIDLSAIDADTTREGDQAFAVVGEFTGAAGQLTLSYDAATNRTWVTGDVDGDGLADLQISVQGQVAAGAGWVL